MEESETIMIVESNQLDYHHLTSRSFANNSMVLSDEKLSRLIHSLNTKQTKVFDSACDWRAKKLISRISINKVDPLRLFITGGILVNLI